MKIAVHQPQFMPWLGYLDKIDRVDAFVLLDNVQFKKNEWQNRNRIRTAQGWQWLTVPVLHQFGQRIDEVRINNRVKWVNQHLRALDMHYARAPNSARFLPELRMIYGTPWDRLVDFNVAVLRWLLRSFGITTPLISASQMTLRDHPTDRLIDICRAVGATVYLAGIGAAGYMDVPRFLSAGIEMEIQAFTHPIYPQCYEPFEAGLAAIDVLLNCGADALVRLRATRGVAA
jgi:hypothetical protein